MFFLPFMAPSFPEHPVSPRISWIPLISPFVSSPFCSPRILNKSSSPDCVIPQSHHPEFPPPTLPTPTCSVTWNRRPPLESHIQVTLPPCTLHHPPVGINELNQDSRGKHFSPDLQTHSCKRSRHVPAGPPDQVWSVMLLKIHKNNALASDLCCV